MKELYNNDVLGTKSVRTKPEYTARKSTRSVKNFWLTYFFPAILVIGVVVFFYLNQKLLTKIVDKFAETWSGIFASDEVDEKPGEATACAETVLEAYAVSHTSDVSHGGTHGDGTIVVDGNHCCICCGAFVEWNDNNKDHNCDDCGQKVTECKDTNSKDHYCDICGTKMSDCVDASPKNHYCDICGKTLSDHVYTTNPHKCDICGSTTPCKDADQDHKCDICGKDTPCVDKAPADHKCDLCDKKISDCTFTKNPHVCDICGATTDHTDTNKDHLCDNIACKAKLSECADVNPVDHKCDLCGKFVGCIDENKDHECDLKVSGCTRKFCGKCAENPDACNGQCKGEHTFDEGKHTCNYCRKYKTKCLDKNWEMLCDICGEIYYPLYTALIIVASPFLLLWLLLILRERRKVRRARKVRIDFYKDLVVYVDKQNRNSKKDVEYKYRAFLGAFSTSVKFENAKGRSRGKAKRDNFGTVTAFCPGGPAMSMTFHNIDNPQGLARYLETMKPDESVSYNASNTDMLN